jgi:hypothetical protein
MGFYTDMEDDPITANGFTDIDDLMDQWKQFVYSELNAFKIIKSDMFGKGCTCDLQKMIEENNFEPDYVMTLIPRVKDCYTECLYIEYNQLLTNFLIPFVNMRGDRMTITDLGEDEPFFYQMFLKIAKDRAVWNVWDLFRTNKNYNTK